MGIADDFEGREGAMVENNRKHFKITFLPRRCLITCRRRCSPIDSDTAPPRVLFGEEASFTGRSRGRRHIDA